MPRLKIKLTRNLRRNVQRGHPWIYREAIVPPTGVTEAQLARVIDAKGDLGWAIYDPNGPLALRMISTETPLPTPEFWAERFRRARELRRPLFERKVSSDVTHTTAYRLFNGEGDGLPGLVCDLYGSTAIVQFDGEGARAFWSSVDTAGWLLAHAGATSVAEKTRRGTERRLLPLAGANAPPTTEILENNLRFEVHLERGQKTGFFLDQRENRAFVRTIAAGSSTLNLFSYTGGFSVYAGLGGATHVTSVDVAAGAIELADKNWALNGLDPGKHLGVTADVFEFLASPGENWGHVLVDPPSMGHAEATKALAIAKYIDVFALSAKRVRPGGRLSLSSCSSHVSFADFDEVITEALARARRRGTVLRVSGQGFDHPYPHACPELRYLKFVHLVL